MNNAFANLYEYFLKHPEFSTLVYDGQGYLWLGMFLLIIPLLLAIIFYKFWDPSPTKSYKWLLFLVIPIIIIVFGISFLWLKNGSLENVFINEEPGVLNFALNLSLYNAILALIMSLIYSFIIKRFSINNRNNPI